MSLTSDHIILNNLSNGINNYVIKPLILCNILDHYQRRNNEQNRVIGTLLGERKGNTIVITNSFPVPHTETPDSIALNMEIYQKFIDMYARVNPEESVVGCYSTGDIINYTSSLAHMTYAELPESISNLFLLVDTTLTTPSVPCRGYTSLPVSTSTTRAFTQFLPADITISSLPSFVPLDLAQMLDIIEFKIEAGADISIGVELSKLMEDVKSGKEWKEENLIKMLAKTTKKQIELSDQIHSGVFKAKEYNNNY